MQPAAAPDPMFALALMAVGFVLLALVELIAPFRRARVARPQRWFTNLALFAIDTTAVRLLVPLAMVGTALLAAERGWGLFNAIDLPAWLAFALTFIALDLALYLQHWATHRVPLLWRMHRVHHCDRDFDVTTAARFHPFEILLSMLYKMAVVVLLGAPVLAVAVFEIGFALFTLFTHANLALPVRIEPIARRVIVTPTMHRIHHSARQSETDSNYGTIFSGWDRLFNTYCAKAREPQESMTIGLAQWQDDQPSRLGFSLWLPFNRP